MDLTATHSPLVTKVTGQFAVPVFNIDGTPADPIHVDAQELGGKVSQQLLHDVVLMYLANQRAGTHSTLRRGQVAGSTKKLFRQKGTGNARAGTKRTNKRVGGGTAKGPKPRDYEYHLPKKAVRAATRMALLTKLRDGEALVIDNLAMNQPKTKDLLTILSKIKAGTKVVKKGDQDQEVDLHLSDTTVLITTDGYDVNIYKSGRNIEGVKVLPAAELNTYVLLKHKRLVLTRAALESIRKPAKEETKLPGSSVVGTEQ